MCLVIWQDAARVGTMDPGTFRTKIQRDASPISRWVARPRGLEDISLVGQHVSGCSCAWAGWTVGLVDLGRMCATRRLRLAVLAGGVMGLGGKSYDTWLLACLAFVWHRATGCFPSL